MRSALNPSIANDINVITHSVDDLGQLVKRRSAAIKLPATVVRYHNGIRSDFNGFARVLNRHDALQTKRSPPAFPHRRGGIPVHRLIQHGGKIIRHGDTDIRPFRDVLFEI